MNFADISSARLTRLIGPLIAAGSLAATLGVLPVAAERAPGRIVTDLKIITGDNAQIECPSDYRKVDHDLNDGSGGSFVFLCEQFGTDPKVGISELYTVTSFSPRDPSCDGEDQVLPGDLNAGIQQTWVTHQALNFCLHRPNTIGGSARDLDAFNRSWSYYAVPFGKLLTDVEFVEFKDGDLPTCVSTACADTGLGALSYLEYGVTIDPYCQKTYGSDFHPIFRDWEYHGTGDIGSAVPSDSGVFYLNAGTPGAPYIFACGRYMDGNQIDVTPPTVRFQGNAFTYAVDQNVAIACVAEDLPGSPSEVPSGVAVNTCPTTSGLAYTFGLGTHLLTASVADGAGHVGQPATTQFTVTVTANSLCTLTRKWVSDPTAASKSCGILRTLDALPAGDARQQAVVQYQQSLPTPGRVNPKTQQGLPVSTQNMDTLKRLVVALAPPPINDTASGLMYRGSGWGYYADRPASFANLDNDVHATMADGDSVSLIFVGTGVSFLSELSDGYGLIDVYLDGSLVQTVDANLAGASNRGGQTLYSVAGLSRGQHALSLVKHSGIYMLVDGFSVAP